MERSAPGWLKLLAVSTLALVVVSFVSHAAASRSAPLAPNIQTFRHLNATALTGLSPQDLQLYVAVRPPVAQPGQSISLDLAVTNRGSTPAMPQVSVAIPLGLSLDVITLPPGVAFDLLANSLSWQPIVNPAGTEVLSLSMDVAVADLTQPEQIITAVLSQNGTRSSVSAAYWLGVGPEARILVSPANVAIGQPVQLLAELVGPGPFSQLWDLGDGRQVDADNPVIVYAAAGRYQVTLQAANPLARASATALITVSPEPEAAFTVADYSLAVNQAVNFVNQSGGQPPLSFRWDFGDGQSSQEASPTHHYALPGSYLVSLRVRSSQGEAESTVPLTVGAPPIADMVIEPATSTGVTISGLAFSDDSVTGIEWQMGDGQRREGEEINYVYRSSGDYQVIMTASNAFGVTHVSRWIHVAAGVQQAYLPLLFTGGTPFLEGQLATTITGTTGPPGASEPTSPLVLRPPEAGGAGAVITASQGLESDGGLPLQPLAWEQAPFAAGATSTEQLFWYINEARRLHELAPLSYVYELTIAAQQHSDDVATFGENAHTGSDGSTPPERLAWYHYLGSYAGEAVAWGFENPKHAVEFWVNSPGHRVIILHPNATDVGIGYTQNYSAPNIWYWVAEFGVGHQTSQGN